MKIINVKKDTVMKDINEGDLVITGEIHRVVKLFDKQNKSFSVITVNPKCDYCSKKNKKCRHERVMSVGYGQQSFLKIIK